nr:hypothetical protein [Salinigranum halophilum]
MEFLLDEHHAKSLSCRGRNLNHGLDYSTSQQRVETADVVLIGDDLSKIPNVLGLGRRTRRRLTIDLAIAFGTIALMIGTILLRGLPLPRAVIGHEGSTVVVSLNGLRLLGYRDVETNCTSVCDSPLSPLGFWRLSILTGTVWGIWYTPLVVQWHNFSNAPFTRIIVMTGWTVAASPLCTYPTVRAHSVLAATLLHGSFNAVASLSPSVITNDAVFCIDACLVGRVAASCFITYQKRRRIPLLNSDASSVAVTQWLRRTTLHDDNWCLNIYI